MLEFLPSLSTLVNGFFIWLVIWWLVLFAVLPFGVQRDDAPEPGNSTGAPVSHNLKRKCWITTYISFGITAVFMIALRNGWIPSPV